MAIEINGKKYRNIQEQVQKNKDDIENLAKNSGFNGPYKTLDDIPEDKLVNNGLYLIGTTSPYGIYKYSEITNTFEPLGRFPQVGPQGPQGPQGPKGPQGPQGEPGTPGTKIANIVKTSSVGLVDTYTIIMTDGTTYNFTVTNGKDGIADIEAGYGIVINGDEISVDNTVIATKNELNSYLKNNDLNYSGTFRGQAVYVKNEGTYTSTSYGDGAIGRNIPNQPGYAYTLPDKSGTFAMTDDIVTSYNDLTDKPSIPTKTSDLTNDSSFITSTQLSSTLTDYAKLNDDTQNITASNITVTPGEGYIHTTYGPTTIAMSIPRTPGYTITIPTKDGTMALTSDIPSLTNYVTTTQLDDALDDYALKTDIPENVSDLNNDAGYTTQTWVENQGYSKFSGSYNDLTDKPTIPTVNDPTITFTQGGTTKGTITLNQSSNQTIALDAGSSSVDWQDITNKPNLLPIMDASESFTFTWQEQEIHYPPTRWAENVACTSTWICYGSVEVLPIIYLQNWFSLDECYAYPEYIWQDQNGYHAVYSTEFGGASVGASGGRIVLNAPSLGSTWTSVSTIPVYGFNPVNNATITFTQGGVNKGSFTVNQWQDQTIALDAAGSSYSAGTGIDITNNEISIDNTVALKSELFSGNYNDLTNKPTIPTAATSTSTSTVTPNTIQLTFTYTDNTTETITLMTGATVSTSTTTTLS